MSARSQPVVGVAGEGFHSSGVETTHVITVGVDALYVQKSLRVDRDVVQRQQTIVGDGIHVVDFIGDAGRQGFVGIAR